MKSSSSGKLIHIISQRANSKLRNNPQKLFPAGLTRLVCDHTQYCRRTLLYTVFHALLAIHAVPWPILFNAADLGTTNCPKMTISPSKRRILFVYLFHP